MTTTTPAPRLAYFVTPHGYGHAARAAAVMAALCEVEPAIQFEIFSQVAPDFFKDSLGDAFGYHPLVSDIGLVQRNSLHEDLPETVRRLDEFFPVNSTLTGPLARQITELGCDLVLCDIAPLGIAVAQAAKLPSILIENFTWDWIYAGYVAADGGMARHLSYLRNLFAAADYHIQTQPVCEPTTADLTAAPISRKARTPAARMRKTLGVPPEARLVMVTMGGSNWDFTFLEQLTDQKELYFVIAANGSSLEQRDNFILLPRHSPFFHPDLVNACDAVIGKVGYSTLAEIYQVGVPYGYIPRPQFRESAILSDYIGTHMAGLAINEAQLHDGSWLTLLPELLALPRAETGQRPNGADEVAAFVRRLWGQP